MDSTGAELGAAVGLAVTGWLLSKRVPVAARDGDGWLLAYPAAFRLLLGVLAVMPLGVGVLILQSPPKPDEVWAAWAVVLGPGIAVALCAVEALRVGHRVDDEGIERRTPWRRHARIAWRDVISVRYSAAAQWFVVRARDGEAARVSIYLSGLETFAALLEEHVAPGAIHASAQRQLRRVARSSDRSTP